MKLTQNFLILILFVSFFSVVSCGETGSEITDGTAGSASTDESDEGGNQTGGSTSAGNPAVGGSTSAGNPIDSLTFDLAGAVGLAITDSSNSNSLSLESGETSSSNLRRVNQDNSLTDAVASGSLMVSEFMVAGNNQIYLLLESPIESCILIRVDGETNEATCVDSSIGNIVWKTSALYQHKPIQFDAEGAIYYMFRDRAGNLVLRRNASGVITDLINDNIAIYDFLVLSDGTVFVTGQTSSTSARWIRKISPENVLANIFAGETASFMSLFPDGNIYLGIWADPIFGVVRYLTSENLLEEKRWIAGNMNGLEETRYYDCNEVSDDYDFRGWCGSYVKAIHRTINDEVYVVAGNLSSQGVLMQYYPTVREVPTTISQISLSTRVLDTLILAGLDDESNNRLMTYETDTDQETDLLAGENIEIYHLNYRQAGGRQIIMFDGLNFANNSNVLCQVDLTQNNSLVCSNTDLGRLTDFQLFNSN